MTLKLLWKKNIKLEKSLSPNPCKTSNSKTNKAKKFEDLLPPRPWTPFFIKLKKKSQIKRTTEKPFPCHKNKTKFKNRKEKKLKDSLVPLFASDGAGCQQTNTAVHRAQQVKCEEIFRKPLQNSVCIWNNRFKEQHGNRDITARRLHHFSHSERSGEERGAARSTAPCGAHTLCRWPRARVSSVGKAIPGKRLDGSTAQANS